MDIIVINRMVSSFDGWELRGATKVILRRLKNFHSDYSQDYYKNIKSEHLVKELFSELRYSSHVPGIAYVNSPLIEKGYYFNAEGIRIYELIKKFVLERQEKIEAKQKQIATEKKTQKEKELEHIRNKILNSPKVKNKNDEMLDKIDRIKRKQKRHDFIKKISEKHIEGVEFPVGVTAVHVSRCMAIIRMVTSYYPNFPSIKKVNDEFADNVVNGVLTPIFEHHKNKRNVNHKKLLTLFCISHLRHYYTDYDKIMDEKIGAIRKTNVTNMDENEFFKQPEIKKQVKSVKREVRSQIQPQLQQLMKEYKLDLGLFS